MNVFITSPCPRTCAISLDDKRVIKMALETAQLLSTTLSEHGLDAPYKPTHRNHPCAVWARKNRSNFKWLTAHGLALCDEYSYRFFGREHKSRSIIIACRVVLPLLRDEPLTLPPNCSGFEASDLFKSYQMCLADKWDNLDTRPPEWTFRERPDWSVS